MAARPHLKIAIAEHPHTSAIRSGAIPIEGVEIKVADAACRRHDAERVAVVVDHDSITLAAAFDSGLDFLQMLGLSGGMPTRVSVPRSRLGDVWKALQVDPAEATSALRSA